MKMQRKFLKGAESILLAAGLTAAASAQVTPGMGKHPLVPPLEPSVGGGHGSQYTGLVRDGGSVFVDLDDEERLEISIQAWPVGGADPRGVRPPRGLDTKRTIRLAGGAPGNGGAILVNPREPARRSPRLADDSVVFSGAFAAGGSIVVELPEFDEDVFVQGFEFTHLGGAASGIYRLTPPGELLPLEPVTWDAQAISDAVRKAALGMKDELVSLRFFGAARMGKLDGSVDATVLLGRLLGRDTPAYILFVGPALAQRTALVGLGEDRGITFFASGVRELARAVEAVVMLDAFADRNVRIDWARARLADLKSELGLVRPRCPTGDDGLLGIDPGASAGGATGIPLDPQRAGGKKPLPTTKAGGASKFGGTIRDGGSVTVESSAQAEISTSVQKLGSLDDPRAAAGKQPLAHPAGRDGGAARYAGAIGDGGSVTVDTGDDDGDDIAVIGKLDDPQRAGAKRSAMRHKSQTGQFAGTIGDGGSVKVHVGLDHKGNKRKH